ncbi:MAG: ribonuclease P protein component 4 [Promethearchaeota archaeon CR_4]|nr:MAG: ribonuclease P protein component 4 [Candidatus Lokiarchaeota archaeon CR_4]
MSDPNHPNENFQKSKETRVKGRYRYYKNRKKRQKDQMEQIALERVDILFKRALRIHKEDSTLADHYVDLARRVCMVARLRLPSRWRVLVCRQCKKLIIPGVNCHVRLQPRSGKGSRVVKTCSNCGHITRYNLRKTRDEGGN